VYKDETAFIRTASRIQSFFTVLPGAAQFVCPLPVPVHVGAAQSHSSERPACSGNQKKHHLEQHAMNWARVDPPLSPVLPFRYSVRRRNRIV